MTAMVHQPETGLKPRHVTLGTVEISRLIVGGNPFSGIAHQTPERDVEMRDWYTMERIKETYRFAERAGVNANLARIDEFTVRALHEHWNEGGGLAWIAQTCPYVTTLPLAINNAVRGRARCCFLHGGYMDFNVAAGTMQEARDGVKAIRDAGLAVGAAGHSTATIKWAADNLELDFFMCSYYNPGDRTKQAARNYDESEYYGEEHRQAMCELIQQLPAPAIHYKVMAAGRNDPREAFNAVADAYRPGDAVCVGVFTKDNLNMIQEDVDLLENALRALGK